MNGLRSTRSRVVQLAPSLVYSDIFAARRGKERGSGRDQRTPGPDRRTGPSGPSDRTLRTIGPDLRTLEPSPLRTADYFSFPPIASLRISVIDTLLETRSITRLMYFSRVSGRFAPFTMRRNPRCALTV